MKLYKVGGAVRDKSLGLEPKDIDFVMVGATEQEMKKLYGKSVGKDFPVFLGIVEGFESYGKVEIAMARKEKKIGNLHTDFEFEFGPDITLEEDLERRDFKINAMAENIQTGEIIDPFNGQSDLKNKIIKHTNTKAFIEDPLRVMRMARFAARFNFDIDKETMMLASKMNIRNLTIERIWWEIRKALTTKYPATFFETLRRTNHLKQILPELHNLIGVEQAHHEEDAYDHTMFVITEGAELKLPEKAILALLLHDLGKGLTPKDMLPHHYDHDKKSSILAKVICDRLRVPTSYKKLAVWFARRHMILHKINDMRSGKVIRYAKQLIDGYFDENINIETIINMSNCDSRGRLGESYNTDFDRLRKAVEIINNTDGKEFVEQGITGIYIGERLHEKRVKLLNKFKLKK